MSVETMSRAAVPTAPSVSRDGILRMASVGLLAVIAILLAMQLLRQPKTAIDSATLRTPYQAVLLANGMAYFGKVESSNDRFLTLSDVYYIQSRAQQSGEKNVPPPNVLIKRGKEWHAPDRMSINIQDVVFIEPVSPNSDVARLIAQSKH